MGQIETNLEFKVPAEFPDEIRTMSVHIKGISRGCLLELERHRKFSMSVKSSRYVLRKDLKEEKSSFLNSAGLPDMARARKYLVLPDDIDKRVLIAAVRSLENLRWLVQETTLSNDELKTAMPEAFQTELTLTGSLDTFKHFVALRDTKEAYWEIRELAQKLKQYLKE